MMRSALHQLRTFAWLCCLFLLAASAIAADIPQPDVSKAEPQVAAKIKSFRADVQRRPTDALAWGRLGMVLHAHSFTDEARIAYQEAMQYAPDDARWCYYLGVTLADPNPARAAELFERTIRIRPDYAPAFVRLGLAEELKGDTDAGFEHMRKAVGMAPDLGWARLTLGRMALDRGDYDLAERELNAANELLPEHGAILSLLAKLYYRTERPELAAICAEQAGQFVADLAYHDPLMELVTNEAVNLNALRKLGVALRDAGKLDEAEQKYLEALRYAPEDVANIEGLLAVYVRQLRFGDVVKRVDELIESDNATLIMHSARAVALAGLKRWPEAETEAKFVLEKQPDDAGMLKLVGNARAAQGDLDSAIASFAKALELQPEDGPARITISRMLMSRGRIAEAEAHLDQAVILSRKNPDAWRMLGSARMQSGKPARAVEAFEQVCRLQPDDAQAARALAYMLSQLNRYRDAALRLRGYLASHPNDAAVANDLAWMLATCPDESVRDGKHALELALQLTRNPQARQPSLLDTLAAAYAEAGQFDNAIKTMEEAIATAKSQNTPADKLAPYQQRLDAYRNHKPHRTGGTTSP